MWESNVSAPSRYWFVKNLQGDVTGILDSSGTLVAEYKYDAWGSLLVSRSLSSEGFNEIIHTLNPFRSRGYMYDEETRFYYLRSRYYDPAVGRFLNADGLVSTGTGILGYNMFAYCNNNPVMLFDSSGDFPILTTLLLLATFIAVVTIPSSENQVPKKREEAKRKYNSNTVNVYKEGEGTPSENKVNVKFYNNDNMDNNVNINIDRSLEITDKYERDAVLDVIIDSPFYNYDQFGSKGFMNAQWEAHNLSYSIASSSSLGYWLMSILSGTETSLKSAESLDIRNTDNFLLRQRIIYELISWTQ